VFDRVASRLVESGFFTMTDLSKYYWTSFGSAPMEGVEADIRQGGVQDERIIKAALEVHPSDFRPWELLPRPAVVAGIAEALQPTLDSKVLDIGTGTGYLAAVLANVSQRVITFEISPTLAAISRRNFEDLPFGHKITVIEGDGSCGYPDEAPYDCISVHGRLREVPPELKEQLADGGRLLLAVGSKGKQELRLITRRGRDFSTKVLGSGGFSPLRGKYAAQKADTAA
jgi:protein-L-isoaspartate(D-aspartate) O-methyltransferase